MRVYDFRNKEVINLADGKRLGFICDVDIDRESGKIRSVIIPSGEKLLGIFGKENEYIIPWDSIEKLGEDIILVRYDFPHLRRKNT